MQRLFHCSKSLFPGSKRVHAGLVRNAVAHAQPTWAAERIGWNREQFKLLSHIAERLSISTRSTNPQVECTIGLNVLVPKLGEALGQNFSILCIGLNICWLINAVNNDALEKRWRTK